MRRKQFTEEQIITQSLALVRGGRSWPHAWAASSPDNIAVMYLIRVFIGRSFVIARGDGGNGSDILELL
jgi:hypothetical protein